MTLVHDQTCEARTVTGKGRSRRLGEPCYLPATMILIGRGRMPTVLACEQHAPPEAVSLVESLLPAPKSEVRLNDDASEEWTDCEWRMML